MVHCLRALVSVFFYPSHPNSSCHHGFGSIPLCFSVPLIIVSQFYCQTQSCFCSVAPCNLNTCISFLVHCQLQSLLSVHHPLHCQAQSLPHCLSSITLPGKISTSLFITRCNIYPTVYHQLHCQGISLLNPAVPICQVQILTPNFSAFQCQSQSQPHTRHPPIIAQHKPSYLATWKLDFSHIL